MCARWADDFAAFFADMGQCPPGLTLDRIETDGNYEPGNCRWADMPTQVRNKSTNVWVEFEGRRLILKDYAAAVGVDYKSLHRRVRTRGEDVFDATLALRARPRIGV